MASTPPTNPGINTSLVTALGGGSGIDMTALANQLAAAQFAARNNRLSAKSETLDRQISTASTIKNQLQTLNSALGQRIRAGDLSPQPQVADASVARATLSGTAQPRGSYALEVTSLASAQTLVSPPVAGGAASVGSGTLTIRFGSVAGGGFSEAGRDPVNLTIPTGATIDDVAAAINGSNAGLNAYVANTATGARLVVKGAEGAANGFTIEAAETPGEPGLAALAWNPASDGSERLAASATDAAFKIDGIERTAPGNRITNVVPGLDLTLNRINPGAPTTISFGDPGAAISSAMRDLTEALNEVMATVTTATNPRTGELARDAGAVALKRTLQSLSTTVILPNAAEGRPRTLGDLGLSIQRDGTFTIDNARLNATLSADAGGAAAMFTTGLYGVLSTVDGIVRRASTTSDPGTIAGSLSRYASQKSRTSEDLTKIAESQEKLRQQLVQRFGSADTRIGTFRSTLTFLQSQVDAWNSDR